MKMLVLYIVAGLLYGVTVLANHTDQRNATKAFIEINHCVRTASEPEVKAYYCDTGLFVDG